MTTTLQIALMRLSIYSIDTPLSKSIMVKPVQNNSTSTIIFRMRLRIFIIKITVYHPNKSGC